jgi:hypothetical protein
MRVEKEVVEMFTYRAILELEDKLDLVSFDKLLLDFGSDPSFSGIDLPGPSPNRVMRHIESDLPRSNKLIVAKRVVVVKMMVLRSRVLSPFTADHRTTEPPKNKKRVRSGQTNIKSRCCCCGGQRLEAASEMDRARMMELWRGREIREDRMGMERKVMREEGSRKDRRQGLLRLAMLVREKSARKNSSCFAERSEERVTEGGRHQSIAVCLIAARRAAHCAAAATGRTPLPFRSN